MSDVVLAVDLGGTNMRMAAVRADGTIRTTAREKTPKGVTPQQLVDLTLRMAVKCRSQLTDEQIVGIAFASPAPAASDWGGILTKLPNLPTLNGFDLRTALLETFSLPVTLENDATAAAIGEHWMGASKGVSDCIHVTLGTGVGGGLIIGGKAFRGADGTAGEIGHICVEPNGLSCGCGSRGCIEQYASATAVRRMASEIGIQTSNAYELFQIWKTGRDPRAAAVFSRLGRYLGLVIAGLVNVLNPEMIVLGGGLSHSIQAFLPALKKEVESHSFAAPAKRVQIVRSQLGDDAGVLGVARTAFSGREMSQ
jgi:glucokinase